MLSYEIKEQIVNQLNNSINYYNLEKTASDIHNTIGNLKRCRNCDISFEKLKILDEVYPEKWHLEYVVEFMAIGSNEQYHIAPRIIIHFPEIEMTNYFGQKYTIYDLFVSIETDIFLSLTLSGARTTHTFSEIKHGYSHSHLPSFNFKKEPFTEEFCLGTSDLSALISDNPNNIDDLDYFRLLLFNIETYVKYESTDTNPYCEFIDVQDHHTLPDITNFDLQNYFEYYCSEYDFSKLNFYIDGSAVLIKDDEVCDAELVRIATEINFNQLIVTKINGVYYGLNTFSENEDENLEDEDRGIIFRGDLIKYKRIKNETNHEYNKYIHPQFKQYFRKKIEKNITKSLFEIKYS